MNEYSRKSIQKHTAVDLGQGLVAWFKDQTSKLAACDNDEDFEFSDDTVHKPTSLSIS